MDLGLERAGMECKWQVEIDEYASRVLAKHWPTVHREKDVRQCGAGNLENVDLIAAGFPCQDISYAGKGAGLKGERSGLFYEVARIVGEMGPRYVVLENVSALLTRGLDQVLGTLASLGYDAEWHCIPAAYVGAPHIRDRVFILAYAAGVGDQEWQQPLARENGTRKSRAKRVNFDGGSSGTPALADTAGNRWQQGGQNGRGGKEGASKGQEYRFGCGCEAIANANSEGLEKRQGQNAIGTGQDGRTEFSRSEWWAVEPNVGRVAHGISARVDRLKGLGNAVVPQVAEYIGRQMVEFEKGG
jgi:DNA (cytosine-5)-methyltransferase 1